MSPWNHEHRPARSASYRWSAYDTAQATSPMTAMGTALPLTTSHHLTGYPVTVVPAYVLPTYGNDGGGTTNGHGTDHGRTVPHHSHLRAGLPLGWGALRWPALTTYYRPAELIPPPAHRMPECWGRPRAKRSTTTSDSNGNDGITSVRLSVKHAGMGQPPWQGAR
jgi:hypothetical protein